MVLHGAYNGRYISHEFFTSRKSNNKLLDEELAFVPSSSNRMRNEYGKEGIVLLLLVDVRKSDLLRLEVWV